MKKSLTLMLAGALSLGTILAACGGGGEEAPTTDPTEDTEQGEEQAAGEPQEGGTLNAAMFSAPAGQFNPIFYSDSYEANILDLTHEALISLDEELQWIPSLAKEWEFNDDFTELTYFLNEDVKWHDGEHFTADDVVFTYTAIADPDYTAAGGVRVDYVNQLVGYEEYVAGEADTLAGVEAVDEFTVKFTFKEPSITANQYTSFSIIPKHVFEDVAVKDMPEHAASRNAGNVVGTGPFKLTDILEGQQYILERNEDYWQGKPYLDRVVWKVVNQDVMLGQLQNEELHMVGLPGGVPAADAQDVEAMPNVTLVQDQDFGYQYMGFKLHHSAGEQSDWTDKSGWVPNEKLQDVNLRQAIAFAVNRQGFVDGLLYGSGTVLNAPFPEASWAFDPEAVNQYDFNPERAIEILDEAGYEDVNGDGFREDLNGNELTLNLDYPTGNQVRERTAPIIKENLEAVGLRVNMRSPREAAAHFELVEKNNTDWDLYLAGWGLSTGDPDPSGIHRSTAPYNYLRWDNAESDELLSKALQTPEAFDLEYRQQVYRDWANLYSQELPALPLYSANVNVAFNTKFHGWTVKPRNVNADSHLWWLEQ
ncbi:peptide-binding protein [Alkalihalobacterium chitinilyticum]|uniref:Peptide-binding protein n=1 Tax=Alkalihalobacterium chitinilyticum TaxID=2980103 RepID=A0ABT5VM22_9BACI|nr:peptide-binding protein [Alkalihalobacterium chitinilyticum]MDE5416310.1 peptide-binding protein [Alkalihalobacterium chitinilyticum]